ncbi:ABC transporter substrate-binding protein [Pseudonocardia alaniniphila]|uniref:ABC transporter substrate-binding protein n=1 Tax=Pseudonocardia alaniniphila TaxID=75291 RepID=A0ABS9TD36_9PSEU|nr:ABC transporter substrate-binding protein [Pseudonocardia alaniniphila]MCH6166454.1 ABC transporter substrate-binding protein [Pseudonocardia alaniniphila]
MVQVSGRRLRALGALVMAISLMVLAGCGSAGPPAPGEGGRSAIEAVNPFGGDPATEGTPKAGGSLRVGMDRDIASFDPTVQNANPAAFAVYDSLMKLTSDGGAEPYLAQSMDTPDGGLTWRMTLRPGVMFSDGTPLDANAVILNVQRHIDKPTSPARLTAQRIASMRAVDPMTVEFTLDSPLGSFPVVFAQPTFTGTLGMIISPAALQQYGDDIGRHPVGAGPFTLAEWIPGSHVKLERNGSYWQQGKPYLDELEFRPLSDTESRYASVQNGDVDVILAAYNTELVRALQEPNLNVYYGPGDSGELLYFNFNRAPFTDRRMREAVVRALDLRGLSASLYNNQLVTAQSLFGAESPYHTDAATQAWPAFDLERAKQLVDEYRAEGGSTSITLKSTTARGQFGEFVQAQLAAVGITVDVQLYDLAQYSAQVVQSGDFDLTTTVSSFDSPYPATERLFGSGGSANYGKYSSPQVDALLAEAAGTADEGARTKAYQQLELLVNQDLAVCWLSRAYLATVTRADVKGVDRYLSRDMFYASLWLDRSG